MTDNVNQYQTRQIVPRIVDDYRTKRPRQISTSRWHHLTLPTSTAPPSPA
jgi:hypothetical protein